MSDGMVVLVETNGAEPQTSTVLRGIEPEFINIDWDEVERGDDPQYIRDILERIEELGVGSATSRYHVGMPAVVAQLNEALEK